MKSQSMTNLTNISVIIPSYNESRNLEFLIPRILKTVHNIRIIVVDDSKDQEMEQTKRLCEIYKKSVSYISRSIKGGRGSAVLEGIKLALRRKQTSILVEMDADLAHKPEEIMRLCKPIHTFDVVVGSRYREGSSIIKWTKSRIIQSKIINFFLTYWLGIGLTDYTNGYRAYSRKACEYLITVPLREKGFIALSETIFVLSRNGFRITEVPISFTDREYGKSNADIVELLKSLFGVIRLRLSARS